MTTVQHVPLGVFGGSGFYEFLDDAQEIVVDTPYGPPAGPVVIGSIAGHSVAFMARHGRNHQFAAHRVPYRANMWALHSVGVRSIVYDAGVDGHEPVTMDAVFAMMRSNVSRVRDLIVDAVEHSYAELIAPR